MSSSKHTPGPWRVYIGPINMEGGLNPFFRGTVALLKHSGDGNEVAVILDRNEAAHEYEANARLIASAPDLLEALENLAAPFLVEQDDWDNDHLWYLCNECDARVVDDPDLIEHESDCRVGLAESAIKKARGE